MGLERPALILSATDIGYLSCNVAASLCRGSLSLERLLSLSRLKALVTKREEQRGLESNEAQPEWTTLCSV